MGSSQSKQRTRAASPRFASASRKQQNLVDHMQIIAARDRLRINLNHVCGRVPALADYQRPNHGSLCSLGSRSAFPVLPLRCTDRPTGPAAAAAAAVAFLWELSPRPPLRLLEFFWGMPFARREGKGASAAGPLAGTLLRARALHVHAQRANCCRGWILEKSCLSWPRRWATPSRKRCHDPITSQPVYCGFIHSGLFSHTSCSFPTTPCELCPPPLPSPCSHLRPVARCWLAPFGRWRIFPEPMPSLSFATPARDVVLAQTDQIKATELGPACNVLKTLQLHTSPETGCSPHGAAFRSQGRFWTEIIKCQSSPFCVA
ncbi:hypothetical protein Mp_3g20770 [Marchantia polymorpha subsp. ruderalis]|uniref:Uncharacterized protein n=2 Tax=Marchantia polymorpha TaxID=3197 RepID=A0AAF6B311_MARPO|nr:hypothetical protein MARPO_0159s0006 [Marchantia polymorpha]BBN06395.1 hypothetical protein Mp_3g20770 [Marchantia polymorpha subsp. ruderalis]|eukprot:PTQ28589.1 hypothetical protein MARPO_0159s0006 [Marchantia polymorpha]